MTTTLLRTVPWAFMWRLCALAVCAVIAACSGPTDQLPVYSGGTALPSDDPSFGRDIQLKYYGAGGVLLQRGHDVLVTAPFFSNPSMLRVAFGEIEASPRQIDRFVRDDAARLSGVSAVLVGHAHYDHLMDLPYIRSRYFPGAGVYGSATMRNIMLAAFPDGRGLFDVEPGMGNLEKAGRWWSVGGRMRFMALESEHAPIVLHRKFFEGRYDQPLPELPRRASGWREGQTLAYLIDFLGPTGEVEFRVHYQDAASTPPLGFPPASVQPPDGRRVDLAIVCMPGFEQVHDYPEAIVRLLRPRFVVLIHWEDFFAPLPDDPRELRTVATLHADRFLRRLRTALPSDARVWMPAPGAQLRFAPPAAAPAVEPAPATAASRRPT